MIVMLYLSFCLPAGTFQAVEHVFVVGVGGGVPHFTDYYRHLRLGDVIVSENDAFGNLYYYCDKVLQVCRGGGTQH